jgi:hypothetical protein
LSQSWTPVGTISGPPGPPGAAGDDGLPIELRLSATHLQWRQGSDGTWADLLPLETLRGPAGEPGQAGPAGSAGAVGASAYALAVANGFTGTPQQWLASLVGAPGPQGPAGAQGAGLALQGSVPALNDLPVSSTVGHGYIVEATGDVHLWNGTAWVNGGPIQGPVGPAGPAGVVGPAGPAGVEGQQVELRTTATHLQWRYAGTPTWSNLVALAAITGPVGAAGAAGAPGADGADGDDGRELELQASATHLQWRYVGTPSWTNLIELSAITGPQGVAGANGQAIELQTSATHVQWRLAGSGSWSNLIALSAITGPAGGTGATGPAGPAGASGQAIELRTTATHVQWRVVGTASWTDLITLAAITGPQGAAGPAGPTGPAGPAVVLQRQTITLQTPVLAVGGAHDFNLAAGSLFQLLALQASQPCWLRVYGNTAARSADTRSQPGGTLPAAGSGFYAELVTTSPDQLIQLAPIALVQATAGNAPLRVVNTSAASAALNLQLTVLTLEV